MKALQSFDGRQGAPVHSINVPHRNGSEDSADTISEQANGDDTEDNGGRAQR